MSYHSGSNVELDVYVEELKLAFEFQGGQHYKPIYGMNRYFQEQKIRDVEKLRACKKVHSRGATYIV